MKTGAKVRLKQPVIQGQVTARRINEATDELELKVAWQEDGQTVERWMDANLLEEVQADQAPAAAQEGGAQ